MADSNFITMTTANARALADRLAKRGTEKTLAQEIALLETESRMAGRLIGVLLRQVHSSDVFQLPPQ